MAKRPRIYGTGDPLDYIPFNIDNRPRNRRTQAIMREGGFETWRDIFVDWDTVNNLENYRRNSANTPDELIRRYEVPVKLGLVRILYDYINDMYNAYIMDSQLKG